jgi:cytochrome c oxidase cbb3-type subunit 3
MSDFTSGFWNIYITVLAVLGIAGCALLLWLQSRRKAVVGGDAASGTQASSTGHVWDEDLSELNTPMPAWWMGLFYITIIFGIAYLFLYPGLGSYEGKLGWKSSTAYTEELAKADA